MLTQTKKQILIIFFFYCISQPLPGQFYQPAINYFKKLSQKIELRPEFRTPFYINWYELKGGAQVFGFQGFNPWKYDPTTFQFDSTETALEGVDNIIYRTMQTYRLDLLEYNWPYLLLPQNWFDLQTGLGFIYSVSPVRLSLPQYWNQKHPVDQRRMKFQPHLYTITVNQSCLLHITPRFFINLEWNWGYTRGSLLYSIAGKPYLKFSGNCSGFTLGLKYLGQQQGTSRLVLGVEFSLLKSSISRLDDRYDLIPLEGFDYHGVTISLTLGGIFGGTATVADQGKTLMRQKDYISARKKFREYRLLYPRSLKNRRVNQLIAECDRMIPWQYYHLADSLSRKGQFATTKEMIEAADQTTDSTLKKLVADLRDSVVITLLKKADSLTIAGELDSAIDIINLANRMKSRLSERIKASSGLVYLRRGQSAYKFGLWEKAIENFEKARELNPGLKDVVLDWELRVAVGYLQDANRAVDEKNVQLVLESLKGARKIRDELGIITDQYITLLEEQLQKVKELAATLDTVRKKPLPRTRIQKEKELLPLLIPGTPLHLIEERLGRPLYSTALKDNLNQRYDLLVYPIAEKQQIYLYFKEFTLMKIEMVKP